MGKKKLIRECDDPVIDGLIDEIDVTCDDLRMKGIDLAKMKFSPGRSYTKYEKEWMKQFDRIRRKLLRSSRDLSKIPITLGGNGAGK